MTTDEALTTAGFLDVAAAARGIVDDLVAWPGGRSSPSVYETGRLVSLAPWLSGQPERLRYLVRAQRADGAWGLPHDGYALVPTLSATEALLGALDGPEDPAGPPRAELLKAADQGLRRLHGMLASGRVEDVPDMPAIEHITPYLIERINVRTAGGGAGTAAGLGAGSGPPAGLESWQDAGPLRAPEGMGGELLHLVRELLAEGRSVPQKLLHALEIAGGTARAAPSVRPEPSGTVGASPAATAAWLGGPGTADGPARAAERRSARAYLEAAVARYGGPVPVATPISEFERGWVLGWLARAGVPVPAPPGVLDRLLAELTAALGESGTGGGAGLPPDADSSSGVLYALSLLGRPYPPDLLWKYETETHFCTWQGEDGISITTNAHVLEAFGHYLESTGGGERAVRYAATAAKVSSWLCDQQDDDGAWRDRWHASPYYATACAVPALDDFGTGPRAARAVDRARRWVLETQRPDGSWGRWDGTAEETAYALQTLLLPGRPPGEDVLEAARGAVARGAAYLRGAALQFSQTGHEPFNFMEVSEPTLWHDKDVYHPTTIVRTAIVAALHLAQTSRFVTLA
ncbi:prenyltransferase/squalene oxidase repeat-containing protein [Actinomadura sp. 21ATH]|uniref:prenyltransferase/squalene oxidase repeat-containing protein n=1 Tax=Actinomadura sp. 21ATH TaxID=1735444 RepID=UPI0035C155F9